jgi:hypothetical protein
MKHKSRRKGQLKNDGVANKMALQITFNSKRERKRLVYSPRETKTAEGVVHMTCCLG